jgi:phosphoglucosamine mutase
LGAVGQTGRRFLIGSIVSSNGALEQYVAGLQRPRPGLLAGMRVVVDCAHGALSQVAPRALAGLGAEVVAIGDSPDGTNINHGGTVQPQVLAEAVLAHRANVGLAFDGDGDRIALADEQGRVVNGDQALAILATDLARRGELHNHTIVGTHISNGGLEEALRSVGCRLVRAAVGDRFVSAEMKRTGAMLGGETCGHLIFARHLSSADGLYAGTEVLGVVARTGRPLSELAAVMRKRPQCSRNVSVNGARAWEQDVMLQAVIEDARRELGDRGWLVVRASGTEPLIRVTAECEDEATAARIVAEVAQAVEQSVDREACVDVAA